MTHDVGMKPKEPMRLRQCRKREVTIFNGNAYLCCRQARKSDA
jgi:hypothetical protein